MGFAQELARLIEAKRNRQIHIDSNINDATRFNAEEAKRNRMSLADYHKYMTEKGNESEPVIVYKSTELKVNDIEIAIAWARLHGYQLGKRVRQAISNQRQD